MMQRSPIAPTTWILEMEVSSSRPSEAGFLSTLTTARLVAFHKYWKRYTWYILVLDSVYFVLLMQICTSTCKRGAKMKNTTKVEAILNDAIVLVKPAASEHPLPSGLEAFMTSWVSSSRPTSC